MRTIYIEGGGNTRKLLSECRAAFRTFFQAAGVPAGTIDVFPSGSRLQAYKDFKNAMKSGEPDALLLVDSEETVAESLRTEQPILPWEHLRQREGDGWERPSGATDEQAHLMVTCMEAWFLADKEKLAAYYLGTQSRNQFNTSALPARADVEQIPKDDVKKALYNATRLNKEENRYTDKTKGAHSFKILVTIRPEKVAAASYHARRLFRELGITAVWAQEKPPKSRK